MRLTFDWALTQGRKHVWSLRSSLPQERLEHPWMDQKKANILPMDMSLSWSNKTGSKRLVRYTQWKYPEFGGMTS